MAVVQRTFAFATNSEGVAIKTDHANIVFAYEGTDGNPAGSLKFTCTSKNQTGIVETIGTTGLTWQDYGVPANSTINSVRVVSWNRRLVANGKLSSHSAVIHVGGYQCVSETLPTATGAWLAGAGIAAAGAPTSGADLELSYTLTMLGGGGTASLDQRFDQIVVEVDYTESVSQTYNLTVGDTTTTNDTLARVLTLVRASGDTTTLSESLNRDALALLRTTADTIASATDTLTRGVQFVRSAAESIAIGVDSIIASTAKIFTRTAVDTLSVTDSLVRQAITFARGASESLTISDSILRGAFTIVRMAGDTITSVTDSIASTVIEGAQTFIRTASDTVSIGADVVMRSVDLVRTMSDATASVSDAVIRVSDKTRTALDTLSVSDVVQRSWTGARQAIDTLPAVVDTISTSAAVIIYRTASDTLAGATDAVTRAVTMTRNFADTVVTTDTVVRISAYARSAVDSLDSVWDTVVRGGVLVRRTAADSITIVTDVVTWMVGLPKFAGEFIRTRARSNKWRVSPTGGGLRIRHDRDDKDVIK